MGTKRGRNEKQTEQRLFENSQKAIAEIKPTPMEERETARAMQWREQTEGGTDVRNLTALKPHLNLFDAATNEQQNDRKGTGILQLGAQNANPNQAAALDTYYKYKRQQDAAGQLENAYNATDAQMTGQITPMLMQMANQRQMGRAGIAQNAYQSYLHRPKKPSFLEQLLSGGFSVASALAGRPGG